MRLHVEALFTHDDRGQVVRVNEPNGAPAPRFFLGRTARCSVLRFRNDVDEAVRAELRATAARDADSATPNDPAPYEAIVGRVTAIQRTEAGPAFIFPRELPTSADAVVISEANAELLRPHLEAWLPDVRSAQPMIGLAVAGHIVSVCASVRLTPDAYEAGVDTAPPFRGHGYAARVVTAWALGRIPLYSTSWRNAASRAVARKIGLIHFGSDLHIT